VEGEIAKYSYIMIVAFIVSSLFNYLYQVVMGILLPKHEFGILGVALSIFFIALVLTQNTFSWSGTRRMVSSPPKEMSKILRTTIAGNFTLAFIASLIILYYSYKSKTYFVPNMLVLTALLLSAFVNSYSSLLRAMKKFNQVAGAIILLSLLRLSSAVVLVMLGLGAIGGIAGLLVSFVVVFGYLVYCTNKIKLPPSKGFVKDMVPETFFVSIVFLGIAFIINSSIVFMRWFSGSDILAGDYNAALTIARGPFWITIALVSVLFPYVSSHSNSRRDEYAFQSVKYIILFIFPICVSMAVDPETWLNLFFSKKYMGGAEVLRLLSIGMAFICLTFIISSNLVAFEKLKIPAISLFISSISLVVVVYFFNENPMFISALSVAISSAIATITLSVYYVRKFYFKGSIEHILKLCLAYSIFSVVFLLIHVDGRLLSFIEITTSFVIYFLLLSILRLFDDGDVDIIFLPLPPRFVEIIRKIVVWLNNVGSHLRVI